MSIQVLIVVLLAVIAAITLFRKLSGNRYGNLRPSLETTNAYLSFQVDPGMSYFISGSDVYPNAIVGVRKSWTLQSDLWKPVAMDAKAMKGWVEAMKNVGFAAGVIPYGYEIFDDRDQKIGNWFSLPGQKITVWIREQNRFDLSTPENLYGQK
jgi:hypothetical protein